MSKDIVRDEEGFIQLTDEEIADLVLTTIDNPYNPKTNYDEWRRWDVEHGYNTEEYIGRLIIMETQAIDDEFIMNMVTDQVIHDILDNDEEGIYMLV